MIERFRLEFQFEFTDGYAMMHKAWSGIEDVSFSFPRSSIKFEGHTMQINIGNCDPKEFMDRN